MKNEYEQLLDYLAFRESSNDYQARNSLNYLGKYQMGEYALEEAGYYHKPVNAIRNNDWKGTFTGKDGVYSVQDFLNNKRAQENAVRAYHKKSWERLKNSNIEQYLGKEIKGIEISPASLIAGCHLQGVPFMVNYVRKNGNVGDSADGYGTKVEDYMKHMGHYNIRSITNDNYIFNAQKKIYKSILDNPLQNLNKNYPPFKSKQSFSTGYAAPVDNIFTPEQIGSMSPSEFTQNEPVIMSQLQQGLIGNPEVDLTNKYSGYTNPLTGNNRIFSAEDIGDLSGSEYSEYEPEINAQWGSLGIPSNNELHQASMNGGTVYVNGYTRSDGTPVRGYYRSV